MAPHIVPSKLTRADIDPLTIPRSRLLELIDQPTPCVIVSGMSGYGKSVVAAQWADRHAGPVGWLNVDSLDTDPQVFWTHFLGAVAAVDTAVASEPTRLLIERGPDDHRFMVSLLAALESRSAPLPLVVDGLDLHVDHTVVDMLGLLVERAASRLRLVITTQVEPALPLGRWRSRGHLVEVREDDLRLHTDEAVAIARRRRDVVDPTDIADLNDAVDGWPLAFVLALDSAWRPDTAGSTADVSVVAQLTSHVLAGVADEERSVVLAASILERPDAPMLLRMLGVESADPLRRLLERRVLLDVADPELGTLRFRPLIRRLLEAELGRSDPLRRVELHRRAAELRREQGDLRSAYRHLTVIGQHGRAAEVLLDPAYEVVGRGDLRALRTLAEQLPAPTSIDDVDLALELGLISAWGDSTVAARRWVARAGELAEAVVDPVHRVDDLLGVRRLDALVATLDADLGPAVALADESPIPTATPRRRMDVHVDFVTARALLASRHPRTRDWVQRVSAGSTLPIVGAATVPTLRAWSDWSIGRLDMALEQSERAIVWLDEHQVDAHHWSFDTFITAGWCRLSSGDVVGATDLGVRAVAIAERIPCAWNHFQAAYLLGSSRLAAGDAGATLSIVDEAEVAFGFETTRPYSDRLRHLAASAWIAVGRVDRAAALAGQMGPGTFRRLLRARIEPMSDARLQVELEERDSWPMSARLQAEVLIAARTPEAEPSVRIQEVLVEAAATGWVQPFLGLGPRADRALRRAPLQDLHPALAAALGAGEFSAAHRAVDPTGLTPREQTLIELLPTHLSYAEIGDQLFLSVNTVKSSLKGLYRKLDAHTRAQAVEVARGRGLI